MGRAFQLGKHTKAEVLSFLRDSGFCVPELIFFSTKQWEESQDTVLQRIAETIHGNNNVAVRSSCRCEDTCQTSNAGRFDSVLNIQANDIASLREAIQTVIASYALPTSDDHVIVQEMVSNSRMSGVIMTRVADDGAPYYVLNYDDESDRTDTVTAGGGSKAVYVYRGFRNSDFDSHRLMELVYLARRLEAFFDSDALDIEFSRDEQGTIHVLQVRPIAANDRWSSGIVEKTSNGISFIEDFLHRLDHPRPCLYGKKTIFGVMPDWNPAEIIGVTPRPLATSLYRYLITQRVWSLAREEMGYRLMPPEELMLIIAGRPYIDVRCSFNSFLAAGLSSETSEVLLNAWIDRLDRKPELHDKVEFSVVPTIYDFSFDHTYQQRYHGLLDASRFNEVKDKYQALARRNVSIHPEASLPAALKKVQSFENRYAQESPPSANERQPYVLLAWVRKLLEECKVFGTLPFSIIARHAFIAEALIRSAVQRGAFCDTRLGQFRCSIKTITSRFSQDLEKTTRGELTCDLFMQRYGHLRPGTYDILSPRYADRPEVLNGGGNGHNGHKDHEKIGDATFCLDKQEERNFRSLLKETGLDHIDAGDLFEYARIAIAGREYAKFIFTRILSDAIETLAQWGNVAGLTRDDLSWLAIEDLLNLSVCPPLTIVKEHFAALIQQGQRISEAGKDLKLGYVIRSNRDVYVVPQHRSTPNWVTRRRVEGPVVLLSSVDRGEKNLSGHIVCIENADPGYDWVFSRGIAGLVTQFGGANSHMTIRCSENSIPAAVGCGQVLFKMICSADRAELDAERQIMRPL